MQIDTLKKWLKNVLMAFVLLHLAGCTSDNLEKMIPADATGVVSIDLPGILKHAGIHDLENIFESFPQKSCLSKTRLVERTYSPWNMFGFVEDSA